ncbi:MAG: redox-regulated ATPase YchF, partial [Clostridiales bacterium]|nr:redox-regulated ATPase YchF [Clostridiales bacterium]
DAIVHVVRCFEDDNVVHVDGSVDPVRDMETINLELIYAYMDTVQRRGEKASKMIKTGDPRYAEEEALAQRVLDHLEQNNPARTFAATKEELETIKGWFLLTMKPVIYAANIGEDDLGRDENDLPMVGLVRAAARREEAETLVISAQVEQEIAGLEGEEKAEFLRELGIGESGLDRLVKTCYRLLGLISFLTVGDDECRAWTITRGTKAPQAAGKIHTDFERGFIRAEVVPFDTLMAMGSMAACREKGLIRSEGKEYVMQDGDGTLFRFNV